VFVVTHLLLVGYGIPRTCLRDAAGAAPDARKPESRYRQDGFVAVLLLFLRSYSLGAGTYTGIEAVSNGVQILKEAAKSPPPRGRCSTWRCR